MQTTVATVLVLAVAILPGALGSYLYEAANGLHWRQSQWGLAVRYVAFSLFGLILYVVGVQRFGWPSPEHIAPATFASTDLTAVLPSLVVPYLGHTVGGALVGILAAVGVRVLASVSSSSATPGTWSSFVRRSARGKWIVVTLKSGDVYLGALREADWAVAASERDVLLTMPAKLDEHGYYVATVFGDLFLPAGIIQSIATLHDTDEDEPARTPAGQRVFREATYARSEATSADRRQVGGTERLPAGPSDQTSE